MKASKDLKKGKHFSDQLSKVKTDLNAKNAKVQKLQTQLKASQGEEAELKKAQATIARLQLENGMKTHQKTKMKKVVKTLKKSATKAHNSALDAVKKAKKIAAKVAKNPKSTIADIEKAQQAILKAHKAFSKASTLKAKAKGAKKMLKKLTFA